jgi:hypothetical protein
MFEDAAALPPGPKQKEILKLADGYRNLAEMKSWIFWQGQLSVAEREAALARRTSVETKHQSAAAYSQCSLLAESIAYDLNYHFREYTFVWPR